MIDVRKIEESVILDLDSIITPEVLIEKVETLVSVTCNKIAVNLTAVKFAESNGLSALLAANKLCSDKGGKLILFGIQPYVKNLIEVTRLGQILHIRTDEQEALEALSL